VEVPYSVSLGIGLLPRLGAFLELFGAAGLEAGATDPVSLDGGLTLLVLGNLQLDVSGGVGLNAGADDWFVGAGVALRVPR
jgi:hypothetical protein